MSMMVHIKRRSHFKLDVWVEIWQNDDWAVVSEATVIETGDQLLIDAIETKPQYKRQGYASAIIGKLQTLGKEVIPVGVIRSEESLGFWAKHNMSDALGEES